MVDLRTSIDYQYSYRYYSPISFPHVGSSYMTTDTCDLCMWETGGG